MEKHVKSAGVMNLLLGVAGFGIALAYWIFVGGFSGILGITSMDTFNYRGLPLGTIIECVVVLYFLAMSPLLAICGAGLLRFQGWARTLSIVLSAINILNFPVGTAIGVYTIWALLSNETDPLFPGSEH